MSEDFEQFLRQNPNLLSCMFTDDESAIGVSTLNDQFKDTSTAVKIEDTMEMCSDVAQTEDFDPYEEKTKSGNVKETFTCNVCDGIVLSSRDSMEVHRNGKPHRNRKQLLEVEGTCPEIEIEKITNPLPLRSKIAIRMQTKLATITYPVVGIDFVIEVIPKITSDSLEPHYECRLCSRYGQANGLVQHCGTNKHAKRYFETRFPDIDFSNMDSNEIEKLKNKFSHRKSPHLIRTFRSNKIFRWPEGKRPNLRPGDIEEKEDFAKVIANHKINVTETVQSLGCTWTCYGPVKNNDEAKTGLFFIAELSRLLLQANDTDLLSDAVSLYCMANLTLTDVSNKDHHTSSAWEARARPGPQTPSPDRLKRLRLSPSSSRGHLAAPPMHSRKARSPSPRRPCYPIPPPPSISINRRRQDSSDSD